MGIQKRKKIYNETKCLRGSCSNSSSLLLTFKVSSLSTHSSNDALVKDRLLHDPGTVSTASTTSAVYSQNPGLAGGKRERIMLIKSSFASLMSFWFIQAPLRCLSPFSRRGGSAPSVPHVYTLITQRRTLSPSLHHHPVSPFPACHSQPPKGLYLAMLIAGKRLVLHPTNSERNPNTSGYHG